MKYEIDQDGVKHMPKPLCTYSDHSYPSYSIQQMKSAMYQRDELLEALKLIESQAVIVGVNECSRIAKDAIAKCK